MWSYRNLPCTLTQEGKSWTAMEIKVITWKEKILAMDPWLEISTCMLPEFPDHCISETNRNSIQRSENWRHKKGNKLPLLAALTMCWASCSAPKSCWIPFWLPLLDSILVWYTYKTTTKKKICILKKLIIFEKQNKKLFSRMWACCETMLKRTAMTAFMQNLSPLERPK